MSRKITFLTLFLWLMTVTFPVIAQQKADTTYTFRFVPQKDMFYVPWNGNDTELARLLECIENNKTTILELIQRFVEDLIALERNIRWDEGDKLFELFSRTRKIRREVVEAKQDQPETEKKILSEINRRD